MTMDRPLRYGMVGGGPDAFIGGVHRRAARMDGLATLAAGAFSSDPKKSRQQGRALHLHPERVYPSFEAMAEQEAERPQGERIDFVSITTPNFLHFDVAKAFITRGFHVICDKPLTMTLDEAETLCRLVDEHDVVFCLTHNYSGYPMVKQARALVQRGDIGAVRKVVVEYSQGWLATRLEETGQKQAEWRTDPDRAGVGGAIGDIGSHAEHLARYVTGLHIDRLCADVGTVVEGRPLDDDANMLVRYENGARGILHCSQISVGEENNLRLRVYGTDAALDWRQEEPTHLTVKQNGGPEKIYRYGNDYLVEAAQRGTRLPAGHPEAFLGAFANVYANACRTIAARIQGKEPDPLDLDFPTVEDGAIGVHFIHQAVGSGSKDAAWVDMTYQPPTA
jgi:predicted dehydrogenase